MEAKSAAKVRVSPLEAHLGYWLRMVSNRVLGAFAEKVAAHGVTVAEWVVLRELYEGGMIQSALAERMGMTRGAISKLADRLEARGLLERSADAQDARLQILGLTPSGRKLTPTLAAQADRNDADFFGCLSKAERRSLEAILHKLVKHNELEAPPVD